MHHFCSTLAFESLIPLPLILYLLSRLLRHCLLLLAILLHVLLPLLSLTPSEFLNVVLVVFEPGVLNCYTFFCLILLTLSVSRNLTLINLSSYFRIPGLSVLRSDRTHSRSGILSPDAMHASGSVIIFVRQSLSFSEVSTSSLSSLDPCSNDVGVNISLNNSSLLSFLNVNAPPIQFLRRMAERSFFLPPFFPPPEISSFWGLQLPPSPRGLKRYFQPSWGESI